MAQTPLQRGTSAAVIAQAIRTEIEGGRLVHGQQLPSTRTLAEEWGTSVATISRAMTMLGDEGLVLNRARSSRLVNYPPEVSSRGEHSRPQVFLIGGYAGSGKTELGRVLARHTGWPILDKDTTTRAVVEAALESIGCSPHDRESDTYMTVIRPAEYESLIATMTENVQCGISVCVTAPFIRELRDQAWCDRMAATVRSAGADLHVIWVRCDAESMKTYIKHRGAARDAVKLANWDDYLTGVDLNFKPAIRHHVIDNSVGSRPLQQQALDVLNQVQHVTGKAS
jgi:predicted kinase